MKLLRNSSFSIIFRGRREEDEENGEKFEMRNKKPKRNYVRKSKVFRFLTHPDSFQKQEVN